MVLGTVFNSNALTGFKVIPDTYSRLYHIVLSIMTVLCMTLAFYISWTFVGNDAEYFHGKGHFTTIHSWLGFLSFICFILQFVLGYLVFVIGGFISHKLAFINEIIVWLYPKHRFFGLVCWLLITLSLVTGVVMRQEIYHYRQFKNPLPPSVYMYTNIIVLSFLSMFGCVIYILYYTKQDQLHEDDSYDRIRNIDN